MANPILASLESLQQARAQVGSEIDHTRQTLQDLLGRAEDAERSLDLLQLSYGRIADAITALEGEDCVDDYEEDWDSRW